MKLEQAAREVIRQHSMECLSDKAVDAMREALAEQAEQSQLADASLEPVAWVDKERMQSIAWLKAAPEHGTKLYAAPVRTKDLTDDEMEKAFCIGGCRAVIAADREKNK